MRKSIDYTNFFTRLKERLKDVEAKKHSEERRIKSVFKKKLEHTQKFIHVLNLM